MTTSSSSNIKGLPDWNNRDPVLKKLIRVGSVALVPISEPLLRLEENIGAVAIELTSEDLHEIDSAASKITIQGARYPEDLEKRTGL
jgi:diketogulonate reductase-like aldo/keto reductase